MQAMRIRLAFIALLVAAATVAAATPASATPSSPAVDTETQPAPTVLNFDDIVLPEGGEQPIPAGYGGLVWDQVGVYNPNGTLGGYEVHSESNLAFIAEASKFEVPGYPSAPGSPAVVEADMSFVGAWFTSAEGDDLAITVKGFDDGTVVGEKVIIVDEQVAWFAFDDPSDGQRFESIDRLEMNANDGRDSTWDYFGFDDLTFFPAAASPPPPPPSRPNLITFLCWSNQRLTTQYQAVIQQRPFLIALNRAIDRFCRAHGAR
jgi:hypothetical protein